jgi:hypothetical protein
MPFGLVTKSYLKQREEDLRREFEKADFVAKEWYAKFRALYARLSRLTHANDDPGTDGGAGAVRPGEAAGESPAGPVGADPDPAKVMRWRARRGF